MTAIAVISAMRLDAEPPAAAAAKTQIKLMDIPQKTVLYTIYRGPYDKVGPAIGKLFALAGQKGIAPAGPMEFSYLNNPQAIGQEHCLTEIRIPVAKDRRKLAGTLGEMTDIKVLAAYKAIVAVKPSGVADPGPIYEALTCWMVKSGYWVTEGPCEIFMDSSAATGNYAMMKSQIMIPVQKISCD